MTLCQKPIHQICLLPKQKNKPVYALYNRPLFEFQPKNSGDESYSKHHFTHYSNGEAQE